MRINFTGKYQINLARVQESIIPKNGLDSQSSKRQKVPQTTKYNQLHKIFLNWADNKLVLALTEIFLNAITQLKSKSNTKQFTIYFV